MINKDLQKKILKIGLVGIILFTSIFFLSSFFLYDDDYVEKNIELTDDGAWCWFQSPSAVQFNGNTYTGYVNKNGDIVISKFDNATKEITYNVLHSALQVDDHAAPSILIRPDGRLMVFYSAHTGDSMFYRISTNSEDISLFGDEKNINTNTTADSWNWKYSYSNPIQLSNEENKIYLFWRGGNGEPTFSTSADDGESWIEAKTLFNVEDERPYMKVSSNGIDKIYFTFTDGHPNEVDNNNVYFVYYQDGSFYKADGTFIKSMSDLPLTTADVEVVYDSSKTGIKAWNWDVAFDGNGYPVIVYAVFPTINDHRYRYAHWDGKKWNDNEIIPAGSSIDEVNEPYYSGGITLDHENPSNVYLSREINGIHELEKWSTQNNGLNWSSESVTSKSVKQNIRPIVPRNNDSEGLSVIWMNGDYSSYTKYDTVLKGRF